MNYNIPLSEIQPFDITLKNGMFGTKSNDQIARVTIGNIPVTHIMYGQYSDLLFPHSSKKSYDSRHNHIADAGKMI